MRSIERDPIVIISLGLPYSVTGSKVTAAIVEAVTGQSHECVLGSYKGQQEASIILPASTWRRNEAKLREELNTYEQQCILFADGQRNAWLCNAPAFDIDQGAERHYLGELVSRRAAGFTNLPESYTKVGDDIHYVR